MSSYPRRETPGWPDSPPPLGFWLRLLALLLIAWGPCELALATARALGALQVRGPSLGAVIVLRMFVAALGIAAGMALWSRQSGALTLTRSSLILTAGVDTLVALTPIFPSNRFPGDEWLYVSAAIAYAAAWLLYLSISRRVKAIFTASSP